MKVQQTKPLLGLLIILLPVIGGGLGWWLAMRQQAEIVEPAKAQTAAPAVAQQKVLYWYDPMMPQQHFEQPGKSPFMDMELLPKYADAESQQQTNSAIKIDPVATQNIGMRLANVSRLPLSRQIEVTGLIGFDERDVAIVQTRSAGFVGRVWPLAVGDVLKAGQPLAEILVPGWAAAQQELLAVRSFADAGLLAAARERLVLLGMPDSLIRQLEHSGVVQNRNTISAPIAGVVMAFEVRQGMNLMSGQTLARINGLATVWLDVAVPEVQADVTGLGNSALVRLAAYPQQTLEGKVEQILPALNESSRSIRVRIALKNPRQLLRPGMSAQVSLMSRVQGTALAVPTEAVIRTGKRSLVMLANGAGRFSAQEIQIAHEVGDQTLVSAGLEEGQQVVVSGQFLIDSEASLNSLEAHSLPKPEQFGTQVAP